MDLVWIIYAVDTLTPGDGMAFLSFALLVLLCVCGVAWVDDESRNVLKQLPYKTLLAISVMYISYTVLVPSKATAYKMLAAYGVQQVVDNPDVKRIAGKSLDVLEKAMDEYTKKDKKE